MHPKPFPVISYRDEKGQFIHSTNAVAFGLPVGATIDLPVKDYSKVRTLQQFTEDYCQKNNLQQDKLSKAKKIWILAQHILLEQPSPHTKFVIISHNQNNSGNIETIVKRAQ